MNNDKPSLLYRFIKSTIRLFCPKTKVVGAENLPKDACIIAGNHSQMYGPIYCELYFPTERYTWCAGEMMHLKEVPAYAFNDFWSAKPRYIRWVYKILSYIIAPLSVCIFNNANTIGVYHDGRILSTFKKSVKVLQRGKSIVIFPEHNVPSNNIIYDFQDRFIDLAQIYYKKTGTVINFVPLYIAPALKTMYIGKPIKFNPDNDINSERARIKSYLMDEITKTAICLPEHTVVPYPNIPKKNYPKNKEI